jgi:hypothetical protein
MNLQAHLRALESPLLMTSQQCLSTSLTRRRDLTIQDNALPIGDQTTADSRLARV